MPRKTSLRGLNAQVTGLASMRPRPDAAENLGVDDAGHGPREASMRPRPDAAENRGDRGRHGGVVLASMRPRPDAAENSSRTPLAPTVVMRFNEAAARCRGKRGPAHLSMAKLSRRLGLPGVRADFRQ